MKVVSRKHLYDGKGGHLSAMAELLCRGWNVAIPEVDVGDDIFAVQDKDRNFIPVQVKSANGVQRMDSYSAQFEVPIIQLEEDKVPDLIYIFTVRLDNQWKSYTIISRWDLYAKYADKDSSFGTLNGNYLHLYFSYTDNKLMCSGVDLTQYLGNWSPFPVIENP